VKLGRTVTILDTAAEIGYGLPDVLIRPYLLNWLARKGVTLMPGVTYERITDKGITVRTEEGRVATVAADTIVTAVPLSPNTEIAGAFKGSAPEVYIIGDSREPNMIIDAVADGSRIGRAV
jgi:NADPH-dependent 2,4-dienoyl-CoA reductase/sulfur reductase-like enzyme